MAQVATLQLNVTGYGQPAYADKTAYPFATSPLSIQKAYALASGFQTIAKPTGATGVRISNLSAGTLTIKGVTGDTGYVLTAAQIAAYPLTLPVPTALTLTTDTSGRTVDLEWL